MNPIVSNYYEITNAFPSAKIVRYIGFPYSPQPDSLLHIIVIMHCVSESNGGI